MGKSSLICMFKKKKLSFFQKGSRHLFLFIALLFMSREYEGYS